MAAYEDLDIDSVEVRRDMVKEKLKFKNENEKIRVGFPLLKENGRVNIRVVRYFPYNPKYRKSFLLTGNEEFDKEISVYMGEPKIKYVTLVVVYDTDQNGAYKKGGSWTIKPFVFSDNALASLQASNTEFPLNKHDYILTCTNLQYQNFTVTPTRVSVWQSDDKIKAEVLKETQEYFKRGIEQAVAMKASEDQIRSWLGINNKSNNSEANLDEVPPESDLAYDIDDLID